MNNVLKLNLKFCIIFLSFLTLSSFTSKAEAPADDDGVVKILAIGNSFSEDAIESYLYPLAQAEGIPVIIGNLYIGGASLSLHLQNALGNKAVYAYRKINPSGTKTSTPHTSLAAALADEDWDYISFQQASSFSGQYDTYEASLPSLFNYVKEHVANPHVKYILHQTWAYAQHSTHKGFANYNRDQAAMYTAIVKTAAKAKDLAAIDLVVPSGTAVQNGRTSSIGDNFCRDGYHLDLNIGRYTAACTWFESIFGKSVIGNKYKPVQLSAYEAEIAQHAAHSAVMKPYEITEMTAYQGGSYTFGPLTEPVFINFGWASGVKGWNDFPGWNANTSITNLKDENGNHTSVSISITERFNRQSVNGEKVSSTALNMPQSVSSSALFGNSKAVFSDMLIEKSTLKLSGLDKNRKYSLCFFGSRAGSDSSSIETKYTVKGKKEAAAVLNAANNTSATACINAIKPDRQGKITITVTAGENNSSPYGFYYLNAMQIRLSE